MDLTGTANRRSYGNREKTLGYGVSCLPVLMFDPTPY